MAQRSPSALHAIATFGAENPAVFNVNRGFSAVTRNGAGDYTLTMAQQADAGETIVMGSIREDSGPTLQLNVEVISDTQIRVRSRNLNGTLTDPQGAGMRGYSVAAFNIPTG